MWKSWHELSREQKEEVRMMADTDVRLHLSEYLYYVDEDGHVKDYDYVYQKGH